MGSLNCRKWNTIPVINSSLKGLFFPPASEESGSDCSITRCWRPLPTPQGDPGKRNQPGFFAQTPPATLPHREVFVDHHSRIPQHSARSFSPWRETSVPQGEASSCAPSVSLQSRSSLLWFTGKALPASHPA